MTWKPTEAHLGTAVMEYLSGNGWDCYPEVSTGYASARADIAAVRGGLLMIVETKTSLSLDVIDQALRWIGKTHFVAIGVPRPKQFRPRYGFIHKFLTDKGIGLFEVIVPDHHDETFYVKEERSPRLHRFAHNEARKIIDCLNPDMRLVAPGTKGGGYMTDFRRTIRQFEEFVLRNPGCTMKAAIESINHHYSNNASARGAISSLLHVTNIQVAKTPKGKVVALYPPNFTVPELV